MLNWPPKANADFRPLPRFCDFESDAIAVSLELIEPLLQNHQDRLLRLRKTVEPSSPTMTRPEVAMILTGGQRSRTNRASFSPSIDPGIWISVKTTRISGCAFRMLVASSALLRTRPTTAGALSGCFFQQAVLTNVLEFLGYHLETDQLGGTEGRRNSDIGRVTSPRNG